MLPWSDSHRDVRGGERPRRVRSAIDRRAAVEPVAALIALVAVGLALGLYTVALSGAEPEGDAGPETMALDRIEREATVGGVLRPDRLAIPEETVGTDVAVELRTRSETWSLRGGEDPPSPRGETPGGVVAERAVTVQVAPGQNEPGTLRVVIRR